MSEVGAPRDKRNFEVPSSSSHQDIVPNPSLCPAGLDLEVTLAKPDTSNGHTEPPAEELSDVPIEGWSPSPSPRPEPVSSLRESLSIMNDNATIPEDFPFATTGHELDDDDESHEIQADLVAEQGQFARFLSELQNRNLDDMRAELEAEIHALQEQRKKDRRAADDVTQQMAKEIQVGSNRFNS